MGIWERMKSKAGAAALMALLLTLCATVALAASYPFDGVINDDTNMRSTASSAVANVIRRLAEGEAVEVTGASGNFYRIVHEGKTGYVFKQYVDETKATSSSGSGLTAEGYPYQTVTTSSVNLRKSASTSAKRLDTIPKGAKITVYAHSGSWAQVSYDGQTGWVMKEYIKAATIAAATPTQASFFAVSRSPTRGEASTTSTGAI